MFVASISETNVYDNRKVNSYTTGIDLITRSTKIMGEIGKLLRREYVAIT